jgi:hypothetical protein
MLRRRRKHDESSTSPFGVLDAEFDPQIPRVETISAEDIEAIEAAHARVEAYDRNGDGRVSLIESSQQLLETLGIKRDAHDDVDGVDEVTGAADDIDAGDTARPDLD